MYRFLMISRILYDKGYQQYVDCARIIHEKRSDTEFLLLGDIDEAYPDSVPREVVESDVRKGNIVYLGYRPNVKSIMESCDCIVHPTYYNEGLSRVLMEALAMKKPIITTDIPGCRETVDDGINGYLCLPKDVDSLVNAIRRFMRLSEPERKKMGQMGRMKAEKTFDVADVISVYHEITAPYEKQNNPADSKGNHH